jgi:1-phosphofructokinase
MIITVTLNPAMDRTVVVDELVLGEVNRVREARSDPGGKGINVSRVLRELGRPSLAMGFVAGALGRFIEASLNEIGIEDDFIHTPGQTRTNHSIVEVNEARQTSLNEPGPTTDAHWVAELMARLRERLQEGDWVVLAGSVPPGVPENIYAELSALINEHKARPVLDADDALLALGVAARPCLVKPNLRELERLIGRPLGKEEEIVGAARQLHEAGISYVVVSMGANGAVAVGPGETLRGYVPRVEAKSPVGAGDSLVAGVLLRLADGEGLAAGLQLGMAAGAATALTPGTMLCRKEDVERLLPLVRVERL